MRMVGSTLLFIEAYFTLLFVKIAMRIFGFSYLYAFLQALRPVNTLLMVRSNHDEIVQRLNRMVLDASLFQVRVTTCLERSIVLHHLLGVRGIQAELCIGVKNKPFRSHAWVEHNHAVINDVELSCKVFAVIFRSNSVTP